MLFKMMKNTVLAFVIAKLLVHGHKYRQSRHDRGEARGLRIAESEE